VRDAVSKLRQSVRSGIKKSSDRPHRTASN
jgi:hypothetical protein